MAPPDETSVKEVPALAKNAEVEKADEHKHAEEEDVLTLRSPNLDVIGVKNVNQEVNQGVNQELNQEVNRKVNQEVNQKVNRKVKKRLPYTKWSEKEQEIVRDIIDNHKSNPETSRMTLGELDIYSVKKLAEAGFIRTGSAVCDLVANMPESIRAMEAREDSKKSATVASEPFRRRSTVPFQSATSLQEYDTLSKMKNSQFALNGKRNYESYNGDPAVDSTNATNAAAARNRKHRHVPWRPTAHLTHRASKRLLDPNPMKLARDKETPVAIRNDSPLGQPQSESDRVNKPDLKKPELKKPELN
ncbi:uncharacterized protein EAF02_003511 [Botrytis sinoallii]|uniref:uncharacterized protein n=1 Tax=Botrytis sinoallii TaxID=1463999 RepID=UPI0019013E77|nr:uncharacterized protein EAF02_003511 [Botrytis sinoallii]KAF7886864.1 hypothetical protein EAF02_003511 [Botrytis sinoallii]